MNAFATSTLREVGSYLLYTNLWFMMLVALFALLLIPLFYCVYLEVFVIKPHFKSDIPYFLFSLNFWTVYSIITCFVFKIISQFTPSFRRISKISNYILQGICLPSCLFSLSIYWCLFVYYTEVVTSNVYWELTVPEMRNWLLHFYPLYSLCLALWADPVDHNQFDRSR